VPINEGMGLLILLIAVVFVLGVLAGGWAIAKAGSDYDDALERDEQSISRGRQPGSTT
jgi:hypothetical protein